MVKTTSSLQQKSLSKGHPIQSDVWQGTLDIALVFTGAHPGPHDTVVDQELSEMGNFFSRNLLQSKFGIRFYVTKVFYLND